MKGGCKLDYKPHDEPRGPVCSVMAMSLMLGMVLDTYFNTPCWDLIGSSGTNA